MPHHAKHPCRAPGCAELTAERYCERHRREVAQRYEKYQRGYSPRVRYGRAWEKIRNAYVERHPLCEDCRRRGRLTPTREVHHIVPLSDGGTHAWANLRALCKPCHSAITAKTHKLGG
jgi:5-methylcytosine-specific restriction protein A